MLSVHKHTLTHTHHFEHHSEYYVSSYVLQKVQSHTLPRPKGKTNKAPLSSCSPGGSKGTGMDCLSLTQPFFAAFLLSLSQNNFFNQRPFEIFLNYTVIGEVIFIITCCCLDATLWLFCPINSHLCVMLSISLHLCALNLISSLSLLLLHLYLFSSFPHLCLPNEKEGQWMRWA